MPLTFLLVCRDDLVDVIQVIESHTVHEEQTEVYVSQQTDVNEEKRAAWSLRHDPLNLLLTQDVTFGGQRADENIAFSG